LLTGRINEQYNPHPFGLVPGLKTPTEAHRSVTRDRDPTPCCGPAGPPSRRRPDAAVWDRGASSLSPSPIKRVIFTEASSFATSFPNVEVRTTYRSLPVGRRLAPPLGDSFRIANPSFFVVILPQVPLSSVHSSASHHESHKRLCSLPVRAFPTASHRRQGSPSCS
jgi:hypothetical protein